MKSEMFDGIVKARANERVQKKIRKFKQDVGKALSEMGKGYSRVRPEENCGTEEAKAILAIMGSDNPNSGWPNTLWERERTAVEKELLAIMDEMQKALLAADKAEPGEHRPEATNGT